MASFSFRMVCRFGILLFALLQFFSVSAAEYHHNSAGVPGTVTAHTDYYLRGKTIAEEGQQAQWQHDLQSRQLTEEMSNFEADSVEVADYSPPCANDKHDPSVCKPN